MLNYFLILFSILLSFYACSGDGADNHSNRSVHVVSYHISGGCIIIKAPPTDECFFIAQQKNTHLYTGSIVDVDFLDTLRIKTIKLQRFDYNHDKQTIEYKLYLNNQFNGKFKESEPIVISKDVFSIRIILVKTGNEKTIHAWDEDFVYSMFKDTSALGVNGLNIQFKIDTMGNGSTEFHESPRLEIVPNQMPLEIPWPSLLYKPVFMVKKAKATGLYTEQIVCFNKFNEFQIYQVKAEKQAKKTESDIFYHGNYFIQQDPGKNDLVHLKGLLSIRDQEGGIKEYPYNTTFVPKLSGIRLDIFEDILLLDFPETAMLNIKKIDASILVDIPYATDNNVMHRKLYTCNKCFLRYMVIKKVLAIRKLLNQNGLDIKLLDCYRPLSVQKILYDAFPVRGYVADPIGGSIHNRGTAIDITLTNLSGNELDLGSKYDEFSIKSHAHYKNLPDTTLYYRSLLRKTMQNNNFVPILMEWWHFESQDARNYPKMDLPFPCEDEW
jgi:zinc D-Ala-D-Ala dipeptidase